MHLLPKILNKLGLLEKVNLVQDTTLNGRNVRIPILGKIGYNNLHLSEPWMNDLIKKLGGVLDSGTFVDVGVNLGQTLLKVKSIFPDLDYVGFEPNPVCVHYVKALIAANGYSSCTLVPVGISDKSEVVALNFFSAGETDSGASIIKEFRPEQKVYGSAYVPVFGKESISLLLREKRVSVIKIDVEGAEASVLLSLKEIIGQHRPVIMCEVLPVYSEDNTDRKANQDIIETLLKELDYALCRVIKQSEDKVDKVVAIEQIGIHSDLELCEYLFLPKEGSEGLLAHLNEQ